VPDNNQAVTKADLTNAVKELRDYIDERTRDLQTELLRAFVGYNNSAGIRFAKLEADTTNIDSATTKRLGELEQQMTDFRIRLIALEGHR
jgi:methylphosphotriester-DNA--protein-cysteine methyltransferase